MRRATPLRMNAGEVAPGEALLAFGADLPPGAGNAAATAQSVRAAATWSKPPPTCSRICAASMAKGATAIAVAPIPDQGIGEAINDRLRHAAAPRDAPARPHGPA